MSFILDALRKSENERQQQGTAEFAGVPTTSTKPSTPRWLWLIGALLLINLAALVGLLTRPEIEPVTATADVPAEISEPAAEATFEDRIAAAQQELPSQPDPQPVETMEQAPAVMPEVISNNPAAIDTSNVYPTIHEVIAQGAVSLPELHIDIHVFSEAAEERFVFINMNKYREGEILDEGPAVVEILPDGAVLRHSGITFVLPRD